MLAARHPSPRSRDVLKVAYKTNARHALMTGAQAASVYYGPAARNPLKAPHKAITAKVDMKVAKNLASEKFVFQKATKMDSPQRREFQSKMSVQSSPFEQAENKASA